MILYLLNYNSKEIEKIEEYKMNNEFMLKDGCPIKFRPIAL